MTGNIDALGKTYIAIMSIYFIVSGLNALFDIDEKLARIGLVAADLDGEIAFILIYCSLMTGVGLAIGLIYYLSKNWTYSAVLAVTIVGSFIGFRILGMIMAGELTDIQLSFIFAEIVEVTIGLVLIIKSNKIKRTLL
jgi:hypothetical protein